MTTESLLNEMKVAFPPTEMPRNQELRFHAEACLQCEFLANDLDDFRGKTIDGAAIRHVHQEMSCLSAKGWAWVLPHYLPYCLTSETEHNQMETEFLLYNLSPAKKFKADTRKRLSLLSQEQIKCLIHFIDWLQEHPHWSTYCPEEIKSAQEFLHAIDA